MFQSFQNEKERVGMSCVKVCRALAKHGAFSISSSQTKVDSRRVPIHDKSNESDRHGFREDCERKFVHKRCGKICVSGSL